jgi:hypothetical protein
MDSRNPLAFSRKEGIVGKKLKCDLDSLLLPLLEGD